MMKNQKIQRLIQKDPPDIVKNHHENQIIGVKTEGVQTRRKLVEKSKQVHIATMLEIEPKNFDEEIKKKKWIHSMNEELDKIEKNKTWELTPR